MAKFSVISNVFLVIMLAQANRSDSFLYGASFTDCRSFFKMDYQVQMETSWLKMHSPKSLMKAGCTLDFHLYLTQPNETFEAVYLLAKDGRSSNYFGSFEADNKASVISCYGGYQVIAIKSLPPNGLDLAWKSPSDFDGRITFRAIIFRDSTFYMEDLDSIKIEPTILLEISTSPKITMPTSSVPNEDITNTFIPTSSTDMSGSESLTETTNSPTFSLTSTVSTTSMATKVPPSLPSVYSECGKTKGCFVHPDTCMEQQNCTMLISYENKGNFVEFELYGNRKIPINFYVAVGFSDDARMGNDSVIECAVYGDEVKAFTSFNVGETNKRLSSTQEEFQVLETRMTDREIYCKVWRSTIHQIENIKFDLNEPHHLLLASGAVFLQTTYVLLRHDITTRTDNAVDLNRPSIVGGSQEILRKLHSSFMILSWMWAAAVGIICARHFKPILKKNVCGKDLWFTIHQSLMVLTWILSIIGFIVIFVDVDGWSSYTAHAILGCITIGLVFMQPIIAAYRPLPNTSRRPLFKWIHSNVGNVAHLMAVSCIFLALDIKKVQAADWALYLLICYVVIYGCSRGLLTLTDLISKLKSVEANEHNEKVSNGKSKVPMIKKGIFIIFCCASLASSIAMIIAVIQ